MRPIVLGVGSLALAAMFLLHVLACVAVVHDLRADPEFVPDLFARYNVFALLLAPAAGGTAWLVVRRRSRWGTAAGLGLGLGAVLDFLLTAFLAIVTLELGN